MTIYTVCTGHYKHGLIALINSLIHFGYMGRILVATDQIISELRDVKEVEQVVIDTKHVFGNLKARVILEYPDDYFLYLDPDVIQTSSSFIDFVKDILCRHDGLLLSSEGIIPRNEVRRLAWADAIGEQDTILHDVYYSAGFVAGRFEANKMFLEKWDTTINRFIEEGKYFNAHPCFPLADQDILNAIVQHWPQEKVATVGIPDWIGTAVSVNPFHPWGSHPETLFVHATGKQKTWNLEKLPLRYPNSYDRWYYRFRFGADLAIICSQRLPYWHRKWFNESRMLPFYNKFRRLMGGHFL